MTTLRRIAQCGRTIVADDGLVGVKLNDGVAHYVGVLTCGLVWACPVCGPKIRHGRSVEVERALCTALERGLGVLFATATVRHHRGQGLRELRHLSEACWKSMQQSRAWRQFRMSTGARLITAREVTWGEANGWHPHRHCAVVTSRPLSESEARSWSAVLAAEWVRQTSRRGLDADAEHGWDLQVCAAGDQLARYLVKIDGDTPRGLGMEMTRGDLKSPAVGRYTPEQLLGSAIAGNAAHLALWRDYEQATRGWRMLTWSHGLRDELLPEPELTDDELAGPDVGGDLVVVLDRRAWGRVSGSGHAAFLLEAVERGAAAELLSLLADEGGWSVRAGPP